MILKSFVIVGGCIFLFVYYSYAVFLIEASFSFGDIFLTFFPLVSLLWISHVFFRKKEQSFYTNRVFMLFLIIFFIIGGGFIKTAITNEYWSHFTPDKWSKNEEKRFLMYDDLEKKYKLEGLTKTQVLSLLGEPAKKEEIPFEEKEVKNAVVYRLGIKPRFPDGEEQWLALTIDSKNNVVSHELLYIY